MTRFRNLGYIALSILAGIAPLHASSTARDLPSALYCLTHGAHPMLLSSRSGSYAVNYSRDHKAFGGEHRLLVFVRRKARTYDGFDITVAGRSYHIGNNAVLRAGRSGVSYVEDPLGGVWTHDWIASHFARALKRRPVVVAGDKQPVPRPICSQL